MHRLLERQLKRHFGDLSQVPDGLRHLLERVDEAYTQADAAKALVERSLDEMSRELTERNAALARERDEQAALAKKLEQAHNQLLQSEKMASIGQLAAGVAHEINNPMGYINSNLKSLRAYVDDLLAMLAAYEAAEGELPAATVEGLAALRERIELAWLKEDLPVMLDESQEGVDRVKKIVQDLKDFSHPDEIGFNWADLHHGIDSTLNIAANEIKYRADVVKEYGDLPQIECMPSQLNQVFMNLLVNAAHAMSDEVRGTITVRTGMTDAERIWVEVADTGSGIGKENMARIFDPFFTTKPVGKGTGLGLSLSFGIVQKHGGRIEVESEVGRGTTFRVHLPVRQPETGGSKA